MLLCFKNKAGNTKYKINIISHFTVFCKLYLVVLGVFWFFQWEIVSECKDLALKDLMHIFHFYYNL